MIQKILPNWLIHYQKNKLPQDILAGVIVGVIVIPQSLGFAVLAGLPPVYGLYSAIIPVLVYGWIGSSNVNAVGPVAITAIMTAQALSKYSTLPAEQYALMASFLALIVGGILFVASLLKIGFITQYISRGVTAGFISGTAILIFIGQLKHIVNIPLKGNNIIGGCSRLAHMLYYKNEDNPL